MGEVGQRIQGDVKYGEWDVKRSESKSKKFLKNYFQWGIVALVLIILILLIFVFNIV